MAAAAVASIGLRILFKKLEKLSQSPGANEKLAPPMTPIPMEYVAMMAVIKNIIRAIAATGLMVSMAEIFMVFKF